MRLYTNPRAHRALNLLRGLTLAAAVGATLLLYGWLAQAPQALEAGWILTPIVGLAALGMELYCRRSVVAMDLNAGTLHVESRSLTGRHYYRCDWRAGEGSISRRRHENGRGNTGLDDNPTLFESLAAVSGSGVDNQYHVLKLGPKGTRFLLDVTADPQVGNRVQHALRRVSAQV